MVKFADGPAQFSKIQLRRTPIFIRVVIDMNNNGKIDALDMPEDKPTDTEEIYAYRAVEGTMTSGFICGRRGKGGGCIQFRSALYKLCVTQPDEDILRDRKKWVKWVEEQNHEI